MTEFEIVKFFNHLGHGTFLDQITNYISLIPFLIILWAGIVLAILMFDKKRGKWIFLAVIIALALHFMISEGLLKHLILNFFQLRARPYLAHPDQIFPIGKHIADSSFPSSHMASTVAVLTVFTIYFRKVWPWALFFVLLMAFARMHNGMHYPTDVLAGTILGFGYGALSYIVVKKISNSRKTPAIASGV